MNTYAQMQALTDLKLQTLSKVRLDYGVLFSQQTLLNDSDVNILHKESKNDVIYKYQRQSDSYRKFYV